MCSTSTLRSSTTKDHICDVIVAVGNRHHVRCMHYGWDCHEKQVSPPMKFTLPLKMATFKSARPYENYVTKTTGITAFSIFVQYY